MSESTESLTPGSGAPPTSLFGASPTIPFGAPSPTRSGNPGSQVDNTQFLAGLKPLPTSSSNFSLDPKGDLRIEVGGPHVSSFIVCSRTMARSSPFWDKMLYGEFKESKKHCPQNDNSEWTVKLPEDNPQVMGLLLYILHGRFDLIAAYEDVMITPILYAICVITDKYDMTHIIRPWVKGWLTEWPGRPLLGKRRHERLWISWELGDKVNFEKVAKELLLHSCTAKKDENSLRGDGVLEPPEIYDIIEQVRLDTIKALLTPFDNVIQRLIQNDNTMCARSTVDALKGDCLSSMLGMSIQSLHTVGLWPIPQPADIHVSVSVLSEKLKGVNIEGRGKSHRCTAKSMTQARVEKALDSIPSLPTEAHLRHLDSQAKKSGISRI